MCTYNQESSLPDRASADACDVYCVHEDAVRDARSHLPDEKTTVQVADLFTALSDPTRVRIVAALSARELCVCDLAAALGMSQSAVSHQLGLLRRMRLVKGRKAGQMVYYSLDDDHVSVLFRDGMDHVRHG